MDRICVACRQAITAEQQWFRVSEDYVHVSCYDKYLKLSAEREKADAALEATTRVED